jgi:peptide/nickel transport system permease protein
MFREPKAFAGLSILLFFSLSALFGPWLVEDPTAPVALPLSPPSFAHWLGTTGQGQDVLAQTIMGARTSLLVGFVVGFAVVAIGALVGGISGYMGGRTDEVLSFLVNVFLIMPGLPLMVVIAAYLPTGPVTIAVALILTGWAWTARVIRAQTLAIRQRDFVAAAVLAGESNLRILVMEVLPNMSSLLVSCFIGATLYAIGAEVGLEFVGLGDVGQVTWGSNLYWASNDAALLTKSWWTFVPTGFSIALVGFALGLLNSAIDERSNPRLRSHKLFEKQARARGHDRAADAPTPVWRDVRVES